MGLSYYKLNDFDQSLNHYNKALKLTKDDPENFLVGLIYNGFTNIYTDKKELKKAKKYLDLAENISKKSEYLELKKEINTTSKKYYTAVDDLEKLVTVQKEQDSIVEKLSTHSTAFISDSFSTLEKTKNVAEKDSSKKNMIILLCVGVLILGVVYFIYSKRKHQKNLENFKKILADLDARLLVKGEFIRNLEKEETNVIINTYKKKDFNNYINELRVNFIIRKLKEVPLYRKYKIAVLSEEAGFSSQNKFSTVFKKVTTISPSVFIAYLQESEEA